MMMVQEQTKLVFLAALITSSWTSPSGTEYATTLDITRNNVTYVGTGNDTTTILGGFRIDNFENITFKNMTVTNTSEDGDGIFEYL